MAPDRIDRHTTAVRGPDRRPKAGDQVRLPRDSRRPGGQERAQRGPDRQDGAPEAGRAAAESGRQAGVLHGVPGDVESAVAGGQARRHTGLQRGLQDLDNEQL